MCNKKRFCKNYFAIAEDDLRCVAEDLDVSAMFFSRGKCRRWELSQAKIDKINRQYESIGLRLVPMEARS